MKKVCLFLFLIVLFSCSVQKRKYQKGFYISQKSKVKSNVPNAPKYQKSELGSQQQETIYASADKAAEILKPEPKNYLQGETDSCDVILFKDGKEAPAKIMEITPTEIKYKRCDMLSGPMYVVRKSEIFMLKYANGTSEIFKTETPSYNNNNTYNNSSNSSSTPRHTPRAKKQMYSLAIPAMISGIASFVSFYLSVYLLQYTGNNYFPLGVFGALGVILGIAALVMASNTKKTIKAMPDRYKGGGQSTLGIIFGIIGLSLSALMLFIFLLLFI